MSLKVPCHFPSHSLLLNLEEVGCVDGKVFLFWGREGLSLAIHFLDERKELRVEEP